MCIYKFHYYTANDNFAKRIICQLNVDRLMRYYGKRSDV